MNSLALGGILKRIYSDFDMASFSNRLKLQKIIYLLQASGISLGYTYSYYLYGPYSTELTKEAFQITNYKDIKEVGFEDKEIENKFQDFLKRIENHKNDEFWLEVASSIHLISKVYPKMPREEVVRMIQEKRSQLQKKGEEIKAVWKDLEGWIL